MFEFVTVEQLCYVYCMDPLYTNVIQSKHVQVLVLFCFTVVFRKKKYFNFHFCQCSYMVLKGKKRAFCRDVNALIITSEPN